jgi:4-hydroxybenzoate polyprenyltransferase
VTAAVQLALALWLAPWLALWLLLAWGYLALMTREFFARAWLAARPVAYLASHMLILPLVDFYATATDWVRAGAGMPPGLGWFLATSYANGVVIELGRKLRAPEDEEPGVPTYTALWGRPVAVAAWVAALTGTLVLARRAAAQVGFAGGAVVALLPLLLAALVLGARFLRRPARSLARGFEPLSGVWTLALYLSLGVVPMALKLLR